MLYHMDSSTRREFLIGSGGAVTTAIFGDRATATDPVEVEAVYVWGQSNTLIHEPNTTIDTVSKVGISKIYLAWGPLKSANGAQIGTFIQRCHEAGVDVYALVGTTGWAAHRNASTELGRIAAHNSNNIPFDGIQLDIEPGRDVSSSYDSWLSDLYVDLLNSLNELRLPDVEVAIAPWWFNHADQAAKQVRDHENVESIIVMSYSDEYTSKSGTSIKQKLSKSLEECNKPYYAALEFQNPDDVENLSEDVTLYGQRDTAADIVENLVQHPPENGTGEYQGVAFHFYPYLDTLY